MSSFMVPKPLTDSILPVALDLISQDLETFSLTLSCLQLDTSQRFQIAADLCAAPEAWKLRAFLEVFQLESSQLRELAEHCMICEFYAAFRVLTEYAPKLSYQVLQQTSQGIVVPIDSYLTQLLNSASVTSKVSPEELALGTFEALADELSDIELLRAVYALVEICDHSSFAERLWCRLRVAREKRSFSIFQERWFLNQLLAVSAAVFRFVAIEIFNFQLSDVQDLPEAEVQSFILRPDTCFCMTALTPRMKRLFVSLEFIDDTLIQETYAKLLMTGPITSIEAALETDEFGSASGTVTAFFTFLACWFPKSIWQTTEVLSRVLSNSTLVTQIRERICSAEEAISISYSSRPNTAFRI
jgi:hypothetical protein